jgi:hypothetical protein
MATPPDAKLRTLAQAIQAAGRNIDSDCPGGITSFKLGRIKRPGVDDSWYSSSASDFQVKLRLRSGHSEYSLTICRHEPDGYSLEEYHYNSSDDDGGRSRYV